MPAQALNEIAAAWRPLLDPADMCEAVRIYFNRAIPRAGDLDPWPCRFVSPVSGRLRHYVEKVELGAGDLLIRGDPGFRSRGGRIGLFSSLRGSDVSLRPALRRADA